MMIPAPPDPSATLGQWNSYVDSGKTRDDQAERYLACPESLKPQVASHMRTVKALGEKRVKKL